MTRPAWKRRAGAGAGFVLLCMLYIPVSGAEDAETVTLRLPEGQDPGTMYLRTGGPHARVSAALDFEAFDVSGAGDRLFIAAGDDGLVVLEPRPGTAPRHSARLALDGPVTALSITGEIAWLTGPSGLTSVDISDPDAPARIAHYPTPSTPVGFAIDDGLGWLLLARELLVFDLSVPGQPILVGRSGIGFNARTLAVRGDRIWLAAGAAGLVGFDRREPPPRTAGWRPGGGAVHDLALADDRIVIATDAGITIVGTASGDGLRWLGSFATGQAVRRVAVAGGQATLLTDDRRLWLLDIENPEAIRIEALLARDCCEAWQHHGHHAFVLSGDSLTVFDTGVAAPQTGNEGLAFGQGVNLGGQRRVFIDGDIAYVADWFAGLHLYALDGRARSRLLSSYKTNGSAKGVVVRNGLAYVADDDHGLQILDVSDPEQPRHVANLLLPGLAYTPVLDGDRLWLASHYGGLLVIDIADPAAPALIAQYEIPGRTWSLRVRDGIAFVAADDAGLLLLDVTDPRTPRMLGAYAPGGRAEEVRLDGNHAYVAFFDDGVHVVDVADPARPARIAQVITPGNARGLDLRGDRLYVADWRAGIQIIDVSDPRRPRVAGHYDTDGAAWDASIAGAGIAFVADWWGGITLLDVGDAERPRPLGHYPPRADIAGVAATGDFAFTVQGEGGMQVYDIRNPLNPTWATGLELPGGARAIVAGDDGQVYVLREDGRIAVIDIRDPYRPRIVRELAGDDAHTLRHGGRDLLLVGADAVTRVDIDSDERVRIAIPDGAHDAWPHDGRIHVATGDGLVVYDRDGAPLATTLAGTPVAMVRSVLDRILIAVPGEGLRLLAAASLSEPARAPDEVARIPLADAVTGLLVDGATAYVATDAPGVLVIDFDADGGWRLRTAIDTIRTPGALALHAGTLYLAGTPELLALTPPPPVTIAAEAPDRVTLRVPPGLPPGAWDLADARPPLPGPVLRRAAVVVEELRFGKPQLSAGEFEALRQQHLQQAQ